MHYYSFHMTFMIKSQIFFFSLTSQLPKTKNKNKTFRKSWAEEVGFITLYRKGKHTTWRTKGFSILRSFSIFLERHIVGLEFWWDH